MQVEGTVLRSMTGVLSHLRVTKLTKLTKVTLITMVIIKIKMQAD